MKTNRLRAYQIIAILVIHAITLIVLAWFMEGLAIPSFRAAIAAAIAYTVAQAAFWYIFIEFLSWMPVYIYPILTFVMSGFVIFTVINRIPGITVDSWVTGLWISIWMTVVNAIVGGFLSVDEDSIFDRAITGRMVKKTGEIHHTEVPGFIFLEIDGLGEELLKRAIQEGHMPTLQRWLEKGTHRITGWETRLHLPDRRDADRHPDGE